MPAEQLGPIPVVDRQGAGQPELLRRVLTVPGWDPATGMTFAPMGDQFVDHSERVRLDPVLAGGSGGHGEDDDSKPVNEASG